MAKEEDRISALPDCLLLKIVSRIKINKKVEHYYEKEEEGIMTTKDQVIKITSTLSKRWQHLWTKLPNLIFIKWDDVKCKSYNNDLTGYFSSIWQTLTRYSTDVNLYKLTLDIHPIYNSKFNIQLFNNLIRYAIEHQKVQQVDFRIDRFSHDDDLFFNNSCFIRMKLCECLLNPIGVIRWKSLMSLCISGVKLDEDMIKKILSGSPCLESLELNSCYGFSRIVVTSKSVKNLVFSEYDNAIFFKKAYKDNIEIDAPYVLSLTIKEKIFLKKLLLLNVSSLVKADLDYTNYTCAENMCVLIEDIKFLKRILRSLGHVKEITLGNRCSKVLSRSENDDSGWRLGTRN